MQDQKSLECFSCLNNLILRSGSDYGDYRDTDSQYSLLKYRMSPSPTYSLEDVLAVARMHPFYCSAQYPPDEDAIQDAREEAASKLEPHDLKSWPLLRKKDL